MSNDDPYRMLRRAARRDFLRRFVPSTTQIVGALCSGVVSLVLMLANPQIAKFVSTTNPENDRVMAKADSIHPKSREYGSYDIAPADWGESYSVDGHEPLPQKRSGRDTRLASGTTYGGYKESGTYHGGFEVAPNPGKRSAHSSPVKLARNLTNRSRSNVWADGGSYGERWVDGGTFKA